MFSVISEMMWLGWMFSEQCAFYTYHSFIKGGGVDPHWLDSLIQYFQYFDSRTSLWIDPLIYGNA